MIAVISVKKCKYFLIIIIVLILILILGINLKNIIIKELYPITYSEYIENYAREYEVEKEIIYAIIKSESKFNEKAKSSKQASGLMQIMPNTAEEVANKLDLKINEDDLFKAEININLGTKYISNLINKYKNLGMALAAYNAGTGTVDNWINNGVIKEDGSDLENIPYKETNNYVRKILRDYEIYKDILDKI